MSRWTRTLGLICCALLPLLCGSCADPASKLPNYGQVPHFTMTDSTGRGFDSSQLNGFVWVVDFIYTNCPAECPRMTSQMHSLAKEFQGNEDVKLVSISVDPQRDTPPVLNAFAQRYGGATNQWVFLTGTPETVHLLAYTTFHVGDVIGKIEHSTKFMLVDRHGIIRGYYSTFAQDGMQMLLTDVDALRRSSR